MTGRVKNWAKFQHYKDRSPPWIKLHRSFLDDFAFSRLPLASKALAPLVWLLAAESNDGSVNLDPEYLAFRLRWDMADIVAGLKGLIELGFLEGAIGALADCQQDATPEGETEAERETEGEGEKAPGASAPARPRKRKADVLITEWLDTVEGEAIPADDPVFDYATKIDLPHEFLALAWTEFVDRHRAGEKRYKDWRATFRNCVRENWYKLWWQAPDGWALTTSGQQAKRAAA